MPQTIRESAVNLTQTETTGNRWRARIIEGDRWGSSGFYSREVLERDGAKTWPSGTAIFFDHPGENETFDRPERSVRDLAGRIASTPAYESDGLYADVEFYSWAAPVVSEMANDVGLSIRAYAEAVQGEVSGRRGTVITALHEGLSVDVVTKAGAGGKLVSLLESARGQKVEEGGNVGQWMESRLHLALTQYADDMFGDGRLTREERIALSGAVGDALTAFASNLESSAPDLYTRDRWAEPAPTVVTTETARVLTEAAPDQPTNVPAPAGQPHPTQSSKEDTMGNIQVDETQHASLTEAAGRVPTLESERDTAVKERDNSRAELALFKAREAARPAVTKKVGESTLPSTRKARIVESILKQVRLDENGQANAEELVTLTEAEVLESETEIAEIAESLGVGSIRGFGGGDTNSGTATEADFDAAFNAKEA